MRKYIFTIWFALLLISPQLVSAQYESRLINQRLEQLSELMLSSYQQLEQAKYRNNVGIFDFENRSPIAERYDLGYGFSELLSEYLTQKVSTFRIVERKQLSKILDELEFSLSDLAEQASVVQVGNMSGANLLVLGSVFEVGNDIQVNVKLVETENAEVLLSHSIQIPRNVFVEATQYIIELRNTVHADYFFLLLKNYTASNLSLSYMYSFSRGLSLSFSLFYGLSHNKYENTETETGAFTDYFYLESTFQQLGLAVLFHLKYPRLRFFDFNFQVGPVLSSYMDKTTLTEFTQGGATLYPGGQSISNTYIMFGMLGGLTADFHISRSLDLSLGARYQFFPVNEVSKSINWTTTIPSSGTLTYTDSIHLSGLTVNLGVKYGF
jgi:TolB-like protein